ncbi:DUF4224 domain-containing protein [Rheinheimera sp. MM224]|jgi:hypothetical protein|uniref:DUF4224 domain-containing protein n=1 Tax=Rheinheimera sp. MM224 TaxID=3019969 RepID=UPI0021F917AE|nr:DUF4224 domain-containing protein [Rheinheimera sp. MM224]CAI3803078.1 hypothetical protein JAMGFMIE_03268 [Rheinheimera sp. MM224]
MSDFFLTSDELKTLTGYRKKSLQIQHLRQHGIRYTVNALGEPIVIRESIHELMRSPKARTKKHVGLNLPNE